MPFYSPAKRRKARRTDNTYVPTRYIYVLMCVSLVFIAYSFNFLFRRPKKERETETSDAIKETRFQRNCCPNLRFSLLYGYFYCFSDIASLYASLFSSWPQGLAFVNKQGGQQPLARSRGDRLIERTERDTQFVPR